MRKRKRGRTSDVAREPGDTFDLTFLKLLSATVFMAAFVMLPALLMTWLLHFALGIETGTALVCSLLAILIGAVMVHSVGDVAMTELMLRRVFGQGVVPYERPRARRRSSRDQDEGAGTAGAGQAAGLRLHGELRAEGTEGDPSRDQ